MEIIIRGFGQLLPYCFMIACVGLIWDMALSAFGGRFK